MKDETNNKDTGQFAQPFDRMRDVDHAAAIEVGKRADWAKGTVGPRLTAYRLLLGAIEREDPSFLADPRKARVTPQTVGWLVAQHSHLAAQSVATILRNLVAFCEAGSRASDVQFIRDFAQTFESKAARTGPTSRRRYALASSQIPSQLAEAYEKVKPFEQYAGAFLRYLGAQALAGIPLASMMPSDLGSRACLHNFECILGKGAVSSQRINSLGCALQRAGIDASALFERSRELRRGESSRPELYTRRSRSFDDLPSEVKARFAFVTTYDGMSGFEFDGKSISLPKARTFDARDLSEAQIDKMRSALRMHFTILSSADEVLAKQWREWGSARAWKFYKWFYAELSPVTQASRIEDLMAALRAINGDNEHKLFHTERRQIQLLMGIARKVAGPMVVPLLPTRKVRRRARAIARKTLFRLRDLRQVHWPYRDPKRLAGLFRTALIVAILGEMPVRLRTMSLLTIKTVKKVGEVYTADIPPTLMKKCNAYFDSFSVPLSRLIDIWIEEVRPFLLDGRDDDGALFISDEGKALSRSCFQTGVPAFMDAFYRERVNMHLFRALHASELVDDADAAAWMLQHTADDSQIPYQDSLRLRDRQKKSSLWEQSEGFFERVSPLRHPM